MDYTSLVADKSTQGSIKSWVGYTKPPVTDILKDAEAWCYQRLRVREMRASAVVTLTSANPYSALPTDYLDPVLMMIRDPSIEVVPVSEAKILYDRVWDDSSNLSDGIPTEFAVFNELLQYNLQPDATYTADLLYYKIPPSLSSGNTTNFLTQRYPLLLRTLCVGFAASYMKDYTEMKTQLGIADGMLDDIKIQDDLSRRTARE